MTTTYDKLDTINDSLNDIKTAIVAKGATPSGNITTYATAISNIVKLNGETVNITPTTSQQIITPTSPANGITQATVAAVTAVIDSNITSSNIKSGITILNVTGNVTELNGETRTETLTSSAGNTFTPSSGKNAITSITVTPTNEARTVNPSTSSQSLTVNSGYSGNGTITVNPVTASIDANITAENIKKDVTILNVIGTYEGSGGGGGSGKYQLLQRISDDNGNEIGTVSGFFTDSNDVEYAVVCLDAQYRDVASMQYLSNQTAVTDLPMYNNALTAFWYHEKETATFNTQKILDFASSSGYTSTACSFCRGKSFVIDGTTYYGQLPNISELFNIADNMAAINNVDTSASSYPNANFSSGRTMWASTQVNAKNCYYMMAGGYVNIVLKTNYAFTCPVLEIPNN